MNFVKIHTYFKTNDIHISSHFMSQSEWHPNHPNKKNHILYFPAKMINVNRTVLIFSKALKIFIKKLYFLIIY